MYINDLGDNDRVSSEKWSNISEVLQRRDDIAGMILGIEFHLQAPVWSSGRKNAFLSQLASCGRKTWQEADGGTHYEQPHSSTY